MYKNKDDIHRLMTEKITRQISAANEQYLDELIAEDPTVREKWEHIQALFRSSDVDVQFERFSGKNNPLPFEALKVEHESKVKVMWKRGIAISAVAAALLAGIVYVYNPFGPPSFEQQLAQQEPVVKEETGTQLTLANGQVINLSSTTGSINVGGAQMSNLNKTLNYANADDLPSGMNTLTVPIGMNYKLNLPDGTEIWMNSQTILEFPFAFTGKSRDISVDGEAYIKVAPNPNKPFFVHMGGKTVQVLGTEFNVNSYKPSEVSVALVSGSVRMQINGQTEIIKPGMQAIAIDDAYIRTEEFDAKKVLGWRDGIYYFDRATLKDISVVLPRWFGVKVVIDSRHASIEEFSGKVDRNKSLETFLENLKATSSVEYYFDNDGTVHFK